MQPRRPDSIAVLRRFAAGRCATASTPSAAGVRGASASSQSFGVDVGQSEVLSRTCWRVEQADAERDARTEPAAPVSLSRDTCGNVAVKRRALARKATTAQPARCHPRSRNPPDSPSGVAGSGAGRQKPTQRARKASDAELLLARISAKLVVAGSAAHRQRRTSSSKRIATLK